LGLRGTCIICHGRSPAKAIRNAIRVAKEFAEGDLNHKIEQELHRWTASGQASKASD